MNLRFWRKETKLDEAIERVLGDMAYHETSGDVYESLLNRLEVLQKMKRAEKRAPVSTDTILLVVGNLAGVLAIVVFERSNVVTSKALGLIQKPK